MARDEELRLVERAKGGNADAFRRLVDAYKDRLFSFVWRMIRDHHEAEDITQAAFVKAYEALRTYDARYAFSTWLFTIAYRLCLNQLRKRKEFSGELDLTRIARIEPDAPQTLANSEEARRLRETIWAAVDELNPPQKSAVMNLWNGMRSIGISVVLPKTEQAVIFPRRKSQA